jgi:glycosyltransferase involved in cell wall biosynthesis
VGEEPEGGDRAAGSGSAMSVAVLIPAFNPNESLPALIDALASGGFGHIIVVDDGSDPGCGTLFEGLEKRDGCRVLHHAANWGKGRALKSGFDYFYRNFPEVAGIVTADADGQHLPEDVERIARKFLLHPDCLVLGARRFSTNVPFRSLLGNVLTKHLFRLVARRSITDTQSGLRCIPREAIPFLMRLTGEGYEFEMNVLLSAEALGIEIVEEEITTVYIERNRSSHFNPLVDSMKIYLLLFRFALSSPCVSRTQPGPP